MTTPIEIAASAFFEASGLGRTIGWDVAPERTRRELHRRMAEAFLAIEAAGFAVVPTRSLMVVADPDTLGKTMLVEWRDDAAPPLVKET